MFSGLTARDGGYYVPEKLLSAAVNTQRIGLFDSAVDLSGSAQSKC